MRRGRPRKITLEAAAPAPAPKPKVAKIGNLRPVASLDRASKAVPKATTIAYLPPASRARAAAQDTKFSLPGGLSHRQKAAICAEATKAAAVRGIIGYKVVEAWRRAEQLRRFNLTSLCDAQASDYPRLRSHFQMLARQAGKAFDTEHRAQTNGQRQFLFLVKKASQEAGLDISYAAAICRTQYKCDLEDATETQLKQLLFTIRNRASVKAQKLASPIAPTLPTEDDSDPF